MGGFSREEWATANRWITDPNAFLFSLRRNGTQNNERFNIIDPSRAMESQNTLLPRYGVSDLHISGNPSTDNLSFANIGYSYSPPSGFTPGTLSTRSYLGGGSNFLIVEMECFQVSF
jgi:hypothetical protein